MSADFEKEIACKECGANLKFKPGSLSLACGYCGTENEIASEETAIPAEVQENDLEHALTHFEEEETMEVQIAKCNTCGAEATVDAHVSSSSCPFCDTPLIVSENSAKQIHRPQYLLPFGIEGKTAISNFDTWIGKLWWAPSKLKSYASADKVDGIYIPFWTYDCDTATKYEGERGDQYTTTTTNSDGETETETQTNWSRVSGRVREFFDDILISASTSLKKKKLRELEPWDLENLVHFDNKYLAGFQTENYQISLKDGYEEAKKIMETKIRTKIERDIGGDEQRIDRMDTQYFDSKFKHILLPVWISAYQYNDKIYQFMVNARTGEVQGERPYSTAKIVSAIVFWTTLIGGVIYYFATK
ncbi:MAG: putative RNA-binding Zn-ribbon protein involved in translation (DUF1610 family) [Arenicella sp.]|jgi:predicted RNA-binding Zn-ribbon protein involved in translation (DUF1610 family)